MYSFSTDKLDISYDFLTKRMAELDDNKSDSQTQIDYIIALKNLHDKTIKDISKLPEFKRSETQTLSKIYDQFADFFTKTSIEYVRDRFNF